MAYTIDISDGPVTCHAWNSDRTLVALCPNTSELQIYKITGKEKTLLHSLGGHTQVISGIDWHPKTNRLVTCSHDRNALVWTFEGSTPEKWSIKKELVVLRLDRAATYCRWSPDGQSFIVATGTKKIRHCYYQEKHNFWKSDSLAHNKPTAVTADFTPDGKFILVSCTDRRFYYMAIDEADAMAAQAKKSKKPTNIVESFAAQGWVNASAVSPDGVWMAYASQDSYVRFIKKDEVGSNDAPKRELTFNGLPLLSLVFINDHFLVGGGFECAPRGFVRNGDQWEDIGILDTPESRGVASSQSGGGIRDRMKAFGAADKSRKDDGKLHYNIITGIRLRENDFTTNANDGRIGIWPFAAIKKAFSDKNLF